MCGLRESNKNDSLLCKGILGNLIFLNAFCTAFPVVSTYSKAVEQKFLFGLTIFERLMHITEEPKRVSYFPLTLFDELKYIPY